MKKATSLPKKAAALHSERRLQQQPAEVTPERQIVEHLQALLAKVDSMELPTGQLGCDFLDCLKITEKISEKVFTKARELLLKEPGAIPHWHVNEFPMRTLSKDTSKVFKALSHADDSLDAETLLEACTTNLGAIRKLLAGRNLNLSPRQAASSA